MALFISIVMGLTAIIVFGLQTDRIIKAIKTQNEILSTPEPEDPMKLTDDAFAKIKLYAAKKFVGTPTPEEQDVYQQGLKDGTTAFSRWLLGQITGEERGEE